jgi:hypothetical protein
LIVLKINSLNFKLSSVLHRIYICLFAFFIGWPNPIKAQEQEFLDDSPQDVHGLHTTFFFTPADLKYNLAGLKPVTLSIEKIDRFTWRQKLAYKLQDLGNEGTATKHIFYTIPTDIGVNSGFYVYNIYFRDPQQQKYYDAKAPYTDGTVVFANYGSYLFEVCHARSFNKNWHLGAMFETIMTDREHIPSKIPYDRQVISYPFTLFGHYKSDNQRYQALVSFYRNEHRTRETGGIRNKDKHSIKEWSNKNSIKEWLNFKANTDNNLLPKDSVESGEIRQQYYLYHQAVLAEPLHVYHEAMFRIKLNYFKTASLAPKSKKFLAGNRLAGQDSIQDKTTMTTLTNEVGIKGQIHRVFYQYYSRIKQIDLEKVNLNPIKKITEHYLGIYTRTHLRNNTDFLHVGGEYLQGDLYKIHTAYKGSIFELAYDQIKYEPSFLSLRYESPYRKWDNSFKPPTDQQLEGCFRIALPGIFLRPYGRFVRTKSPIYFKLDKNAKQPSTVVEPFQATGHADITTYGANINFTLWSYFHLDNEVAFSQVVGPAADAFRIPKWYINFRGYYEQGFYEGKSGIETGIEVNWKSSYKADGYDPITQQFFIQDNFLIYAYPIVELFFNFRIKTFRGFLKVVHLNQAMPPSIPGYYVTPFYPGQVRSVDVGVSWSLFD